MSRATLLLPHLPTPRACIGGAWPLLPAPSARPPAAAALAWATVGLTHRGIFGAPVAYRRALCQQRIAATCYTVRIAVAFVGGGWRYRVYPAIRQAMVTHPLSLQCRTRRYHFSPLPTCRHVGKGVTRE